MPCSPKPHTLGLGEKITQPNPEESTFILHAPGTDYPGCKLGWKSPGWGILLIMS